MTIQHSVLTGAELHEPKGAAAANSGEVYISDGAASGAWAKPTAVNSPITDSGGFFTGTEVEAALQELGPKVHYLGGVISDISTASFIMIPLPDDCVVDSIQTVLSGAIATADSIITASRGGDAATLGTVTVAFTASAEGDFDENVSLTNNTVTQATHKYIKVATDGGSTNAVPVYIQIQVTI